MKTQHQKIVAIMCQNPHKRFWQPHEIMKIVDPDLFVGYEASARLSELASQYPQMIESRRNGKFMERRMKFETGKHWYPTIPKDLQEMVRRYYKRPATQQELEYT